MNVAVGFDPRQPVAYQVLCHSIWSHARKPISITRLALAQLPIRRSGLTEFTYSRFLTPWLFEFKGFSVFLDSDMLVRADLHDLVATAYLDSVVNGPASVWVVPHEKAFERPSVMVFDNERCGILTPEFVESGANPLFDLAWADRVGSLPMEWNHLVDYDLPNPEAKIVHFTKGLPLPTWPTERHEFAAEWAKTYRESLSTCSFEALMGRSVHVTK